MHQSFKPRLELVEPKATHRKPKPARDRQPAVAPFAVASQRTATTRRPPVPSIRSHPFQQQPIPPKLAKLVALAPATQPYPRPKLDLVEAPIRRRSRRKKARSLNRRKILSIVTVALVAIGITAFLTKRPISTSPSSNAAPAQAAPPTLAESSEPKTRETLVYNVRQPPKLQHSQELQAIVDEAVSLATKRGLKPEPLSIALIDLKKDNYAGYQENTPRYPASVVKLFWMVLCYAQLEQGILQPDATLQADLREMIINSDNDAASRIFDRITDTTSGSELSGAELTTWINQRLQINRFFRDAGYDGLSISQKNYPVASLAMEVPEGRELQMQDETQKPIQSVVTANQVARLMYEIYNGKAVSRFRTHEMIALLARDLHPAVWKHDPENSIAGFLGESLPGGAHFAAKLGMTSKVRHEVALVETKDGKTAYILAVFGTDPAYSQDSTILPEISKLIFERMATYSAKNS